MADFGVNCRNSNETLEGILDIVRHRRLSAVGRHELENLGLVARDLLLYQLNKHYPKWTNSHASISCILRKFSALGLEADDLMIEYSTTIEDQLKGSAVLDSQTFITMARYIRAQVSTTMKANPTDFGFTPDHFECKSPFLEALHAYLEREGQSGIWQDEAAATKEDEEVHRVNSLAVAI